MKIIGYAIIVCLLIIEIIFYYHNQKEEFKNKLKKEKEEENKNTTPNEIKPMENSLLSKLDKLQENNDNIKPWYKIRDLNNSFNEYILKLNNFNESKLVQWKELIKNLKYDKINKKISYTTQQEGEALAITNLILSNLNNDIELKEILDNNLLQISIKKATNYKLVAKKLRELIESANSKEIEESFDFDVDTYNIDQNNSHNKQDPFQPYIGKEYSLL